MMAMATARKGFVNIGTLHLQKALHDLLDAGVTACDGAPRGDGLRFGEEIWLDGMLMVGAILQFLSLDNSVCWTYEKLTLTGIKGGDVVHDVIHSLSSHIRPMAAHRQHFTCGCPTVLRLYG